MDDEIAKATSEGVRWHNHLTAGGRLRFRTDSPTIGIKVSYEMFLAMPHMTLGAQAGFTLLEKKGENFIHKGRFFPGANDKTGFTAFATVGEGAMREYILHFPLYGEVKTLEIVLKAGAKVEHGEKYREIKPILYYGSSITQGGCASRSDTSYQGFINKWNDIDYINLGFSGCAKGEDAMINYLATIDCSLFVCDYDHNAPSVQHLKDTHYPLYKAFRKTHPDTPVIFITKPDYDYDPNGDARAKVVKATYRKAKRDGDENVYFIHGKDFYGKHDRDAFAVDGCHPTDAGFYLMAKKIYATMKKISPVFK